MDKPCGSNMKKDNYDLVIQIDDTQSDSGKVQNGSREFSQVSLGVALTDDHESVSHGKLVS